MSARGALAKQHNGWAAAASGLSAERHSQRRPTLDLRGTGSVLPAKN